MKQTIKFELGPIQKEWIKSLRENPERQMTSALGRRNLDGSYNACCLGEAGLIAGVCEWTTTRLYGEILTIKNFPSQRGVLNEGTFNAIGLYSENGLEKEGFLWREKFRNDQISEQEFHNRIEGLNALTDLNDNGTTWPEIADLLESNPERWFKECK